MSKATKTEEQPTDHQTLLLRDVPVEVLDSLGKRAAEMRPPVRRNDFIKHLLQEAAADRITFDARPVS